MSLVTTNSFIISRCCCCCRSWQEWLFYVQLLWLSAAYAAAIVLRFDGSVRPWADPGFPMIPSLVRSKDQQDALVAARHSTAGCAASVQFLLPQHNINNNNGRNNDNIARILVVGGKCLPHVKTPTEAEYEGLLFGLEIVANLLAGASHSHSNGHGNLLLPHEEEKELLIQGDCLTVLQLIRSTSRARKWDTYRVKADQLMSRIININKKSKVRKPPPFLIKNIETDHIPRAHNSLCDRVAAQTVLWQLQQAERATWEELQSESSGNRLSSCGSSSSNSRDDDVDDALESLWWWKHRIKHVPHSRRPWFYQTLAEIAMESGEYPSLVGIGEFMERELKKVWNRRCKKDERVLERLLLASVIFQLAGCKRQNRQKKIKKLQNTHRHLLLGSADLVNRIVNQNVSISIVRTLLPPRPPTTTSPMMMGTRTGTSVVTTTTCAKDTDGITPSSLRHLTAQALTTEEWLKSGSFVFSIIERAPDPLGDTLLH